MSEVQLNLIPDTKLALIEAEHKKKTIITTSALISAICFGLFLLTFLFVTLVQHVQLSSASNSLQTESKKLAQTPNAVELLTIQNQLASLSSLQQSKHINSRIFSFFSQLTPPSVRINQLSVDTTTNIIQVSGSADTAASVNAYIDTLKNASYSFDGTTSKAAFPSVVENSFGFGANNVSYSLNIDFDPSILANNQTDKDGKPLTPKLNIPTGSSGTASGNIFSGGQ